MEELEYTIKMQMDMINAQLKKIMDNTARLQTLIEQEDWHGYGSMIWIDGHVAEDIACMSALIMKQRTLVDALHMVKKAREEQA